MAIILSVCCVCKPPTCHEIDCQKVWQIDSRKVTKSYCTWRAWPETQRLNWANIEWTSVRICSCSSCYWDDLNMAVRVLPSTCFQHQARSDIWNDQWLRVNNIHRLSTGPVSFRPAFAFSIRELENYLTGDNSHFANTQSTRVRGITQRWMLVQNEANFDNTSKDSRSRL